MKIPFGDWLPDLPDLDNPGLIKCQGVFPQATSYIPVPKWTSITGDITPLNAISGDGGLAGVNFGMIDVADSEGTVFIYLGDKTKLYEVRADNTINDESGTTYTAGINPGWEFVVFNNNVLATNFTDPLQSMTLGAGLTSAFADHITGTLKPKGRRMAVVRDFVVLGDTNDTTDGNVPWRVWWSAFGNSTNFDPDSATQCDFEDIKSGGKVTKIVGGVEYAIVFQEKKISRMTYVGSPVVFRFDAVDRQRGCPYPNSIAEHGRMIFYMSEEGPHIFDGTNSTPIGEGKMNRTFLNEFDPNQRDGISAAIDPKRKLYLIMFPGAGATGGMSNKIYAYYWPAARWSEIPIDTSLATRLIPLFLAKIRTFGYTLEGLDAIGTNIDDADVFPFSFDSDAYKGGRFQIRGISQAGTIVTLDGTNQDATFGLQESRMIDGKRSFIENIRPLVDGTNAVTGRLGRREQTGDAVTFTSTTSMNAIGEIPFRSTSRYHRPEIFVAEDETWSHAIGIDIPPDSVRPVGRN